MFVRFLWVLIVFASVLPDSSAGEALQSYLRALYQRTDEVEAKLRKGVPVSAKELQALPPDRVWRFITNRLLTVDQIATMPPDLAFPVLILAAPDNDKIAKKITQIPGWDQWFEKRLAHLAQYKDGGQRFGEIAPHLFADEFVTPELEEMIPGAREEMDAARIRGVEGMDQTMKWLVRGQTEIIRAEQHTLIETLSRIGSVESIRLIGPYLFVEGGGVDLGGDQGMYEGPAEQATSALRSILKRQKDVSAPPKTLSVPAWREWWRENAAKYGGVVPEIKPTPPVTPPPKHTIPAATPPTATPSTATTPPPPAEKPASATKPRSNAPWIITAAVLTLLVVAFALKRHRSNPPS
jgi:hypothetical protein